MSCNDSKAALLCLDLHLILIYFACLNQVDCYLHSCKGNNNRKCNFYVEKVHIAQLLIHQERWKGQKSCSAVKMTRLWIFSKIITRQGWDSHVIFKAHPTYFRQHIINAKWSKFSKYLFTTLKCYSSKWGFLPWPVCKHCGKHLARLRVIQPPTFLIQTFWPFIGWVPSWSEWHLHDYLTFRYYL